MEDHATTRDAKLGQIAARRRSWVLRTLGRLLLGLVFLFFVVLVLREERHRSLAIEDAESRAAMLQQAVRGAGLLPLDLHPDLSEYGERTRYSFVSFNRDEARQLRSISDPVIVAYTHEIQLPFRSDGRAVVMFSNGECYAEWLTLGEFHELLQSQREAMDEVARMQRERMISGP